MQPAILWLSKNDRVLSALIQTYPKPTFAKHDKYYDELVSSIISQQLSVKAAQAIELRFIALFDGIFPAPEQLLSKDIEELRAVGLSRPKARYVQDLAQKVISKEVDFKTLDSLSNQQIIDELTQVKGIGEWTVHMFLMFCMGRLDVLPVGDLGIRNGVTKLYDLAQTATPDDVRRIAEANNWQPYETVASWYIWQSLENVPSSAATS